MIVRTHKRPTDSPFRRTVHLSDSKRVEMLYKLEEISRRADTFDRPSETETRVVNFRVTVHHPGGGSAKFLVFTHLFSSGGIWFLHSGYLNSGTQCVFIVPRGDDQEGGVLGVVERCEHVEGNIHAVGVRFESEVDTDLLIAPVRKGETSARSVALPSLDARVLLLDDQAADRELLAFHLRSTGLNLTWRQRLDDALDLLRGEPVDLIICELNLSDGPGEQAIKILAAESPDVPIIVLTAESSPQRLADAKAAGAFSIVPKPYDPEQLLVALIEALRARQEATAQAVAAQPVSSLISSSLASKLEMVPLIEAYITQANRMVSDLITAVGDEDLATVRRLCLAIKGSGTGYGYEAFSEAADRAVIKLDISNSVPETSEQLDELCGIGRRLCVHEPKSTQQAERAA